jgi:hypothetical protein
MACCFGHGWAFERSNPLVVSEFHRSVRDREIASPGIAIDRMNLSLPVALEMPADVKRAVEETQRQLLEAQETAWREAFKPHAIILTERERPELMRKGRAMGDGQRLQRVLKRRRMANKRKRIAKLEKRERK